MDLQNAKIIGYYSLPPLSLAEMNPDAYANSLREIPPGAGICHHCGRSIRHNVLIKDENGSLFFIGMDCAQKVGIDPALLRMRWTHAEKEKWERAREEILNECREKLLAEMEAKAQHLKKVGFIIDLLRSQESSFHHSLADQLSEGYLSPRQSAFAAKLISSTGRRNKKNARAWDEIENLCQGYDPEEEE